MKTVSQRTIVSLPGQTLDAIAYAAYGNRPTMLDALIKANPSAVRLGVILPDNTPITLPEIENTPRVVPIINLWN